MGTEPWACFAEAFALCELWCLSLVVHCNIYLGLYVQVDVAAKRCQGLECTKHPSFGIPGGKAQFCAKHKSADMVCYYCMCLIVHFVQAASCDQQCLQDGVHCNRVLRCLQVDVHSKRCQGPGCMKLASFGFPGGRKEFCSEHKSADMVCYQCPCLRIHSVQAASCDQQCLHNGVYGNCVLRCLQVNVGAKRCQAPGCAKGPSFGFPGGQAQSCAKHKSVGMVCHQYICLLAYFVLAALYDQQCFASWGIL